MAKNELENHDQADLSDHFEPAMLKYSENDENTNKEGQKQTKQIIYKDKLHFTRILVL